MQLFGWKNFVLSSNFGLTAIMARSGGEDEYEGALEHNTVDDFDCQL